MTADAARQTRRIIVHGKVQGVSFRAWTVAQATALGLDGWVRNRADGTVEVVAAGPVERLDALVAHCRRGPPAARVDRVAVVLAEPAEVHAPGFMQRPDA